MCAEADRREDAPKMGQPGWLPGEDAIRRAEFAARTPGELKASCSAAARAKQASRSSVLQATATPGARFGRQEQLQIGPQARHQIGA